MLRLGTPLAHRTGLCGYDVLQARRGNQQRQHENRNSGLHTITSTRPFKGLTTHDPKNNEKDDEPNDS